MFHPPYRLTHVLLLVLMLLSLALASVPGLAQELSPALEAARKQLNDPDPVKRAEAIGVMARLADGDVMVALNHALGDADPRVRLAALDVLQMPVVAHDLDGDTWIYRPDVLVLLKLFSDPAAAIRRAAALVVGNTGDTASIDPLMKLLDDPQADVRTAAITALGKMHSPRVIPMLLALLEEQEPAIRQAAAGALAGLGEIDKWRVALPNAERRSDALTRKALSWDEAIAGLGRLLTDPEPAVRHAAIISLLAFHDRRATGDKVLEAMTDIDPAIRIAAINAADARWNYNPQVTNRFITMFPAEQDNAVRAALARRLSQLRNPRCGDVLLAALHNPDVVVRSTVIWALGQIRERRAVDPLLLQLQDRDVTIRKAAVSALENVHDARAIAGLITAIADPEPTVRYQTLSALCQFHDVQVIPGLLSVVKTPTSPLRNQALYALRSYKDPRIVEVANACLHDGDMNIRLYAAIALATNGLDSGYRALAVCSKQPDIWNRYEFLSFLGEVKDTRALAILLSINTSAQLGTYYFETLAKYDDPRVTQRFMDALQDKNATIRRTALQSVSQVHSPALRKAMSALLSSRDTEMRRKVVEMMCNQPTTADLPALLRALTDRQADIRIIAISGLEQIHCQESCTALLRLSLREKNAHVRDALMNTVVWGLNKFYTIEMLRPLLSSSDSFLRCTGLDALQNNTTPQAVAIVTRMTKDADPNVRAKAVDILAKNGSDRTILLTALKDLNATVRIAAINATGYSRINVNAAGYGRDERLNAALLAIIGNKRDPLRAEAIDAFHHSADKPISALLLKIAADPTDPLQARAVSALNVSENKEAVGQLLALLPAAAPKLRTTLLTTLAEGVDPRLIELFLPLLRGDDEIERLLALKALSRNADTRVVTELMSLFKAQVTADDLEKMLSGVGMYDELESINDIREDSSVYEASSLQFASALLRVGDSAIDAIDALLTDTNPLQRAAGAALLASPMAQRAQRSLPLLVAALRDDDISVRTCAARALRNRGDVSTLPALLTATQDTNLRVRLEVIYALGAIQDMRAEATLLALLKDPAEAVQLAAVIALKKLGSPHAAQPLLDCLHAAQGVILRAALLDTLGEMKEARVKDDALAALQSEDRLLRVNAIFALGMIKEPAAVQPLCKLLTRSSSSDDNEYSSPDMGNTDVSLSLNNELNNMRRGYGQDDTIKALGEIGDPSAIPALLAALRTGEHGNRGNLVMSLYHCGLPIPRLQQVIMPLLVQEAGLHGGGLRYELCNTEIGDNCMLAALQSTNVLLRTQAVRYFAESINYRYCNDRDNLQAAWKSRIEARAITPLLALLRDDSAEVRGYAVLTLAGMPSTRATRPLLALLQRSLALPQSTRIESEIRQYCALALKNIADPSSVTPLLGLLRDGKAESRLLLVGILGNIKDARAKEALAGALHDKDNSVRIQAAILLARQGDARATEPLIRYVEQKGALSKEESTWIEALTTLASLNDRRADTAVMNALASATGEYGRNYIYWFCTDPRATDYLATHLQQLDDEGRNALFRINNILAVSTNTRANPSSLLRIPPPALAIVFAKLRDARIVAALVAATRKDPSTNSWHAVFYPESAITALGYSSAPEALPALLNCLETGAIYTRRLAAEALGRQKAPQAIPALITALQEFGGDARQAPADALAAITGQHFGVDAAKWQAWAAQAGVGK